MLTLKYQEIVKTVLVTMVLGLLLFVGPASAKKARSGSGKSAGGGQKSQRVARASSGSRVQRSSSAGRSSAKSGVSQRVSKSRIGVTASRSSGRSRVAGTVRHSVRQSGRTVSMRRPGRIYSRQLGKATPSHTSQPHKVVSDNRKSSGRFVRVRRSVEVSSSVGKQAVARSSSRISSGKTSGIVAFVGEKRSVVTRAVKRAGDSKLKTSTAETLKSNSSRVVKKSKSIVKQPEKRIKASRKRIGRIIKADGEVPSVTTERIGGSKPNVDISKTATSIGSKALRRSKSIVRQPGKKAKTPRKGVGGAIRGHKEQQAGTAKKRTGENKLSIGTAEAAKSNSSGVLRRSGTIVERTGKGGRAGRESYRTKRVSGSSSRSGGGVSFRRQSLFTRPASEGSLHTRPSWEKSQHIRVESRKVFSRSRPAISRSREVIARRRKSCRGEGRFSKLMYRERTNIVRHIRHHEHVYLDRHDRIHRTIVRPRYRFAVYYNWGPWFRFRYFYPYYHRKYVFVSLGGYWPVGYRYMRYYWYGYHPYCWYGYYPIAREVGGDTYNYYTYNYYNGDAAGAESYQTTSDIAAVDHTTFADVRERLAQQAVEEPEEVTQADRYFDDAVKAFEAGGYETAAELFAKAMELAPDDMVLGFAYCQALFAGEKYTEAAEVLRSALSKISPEKEGVFYPRGLYAEDDVLFEQIDRLAEKAELYSFDGNLQLLLGYHLLGIGEIEESVEPLRLANQDLENASSAAVLLSLVEKMRIQSADDADD